MDLSRFKSGSDIRGYALGDESNPLYMSDDMVMRCCAAFVNWLKTRTGKDKLYISVGHDSRLSAERIKAAAVKALTSHGVSVADCSLCFKLREPRQYSGGSKGDGQLRGRGCGQRPRHARLHPLRGKHSCRQAGRQPFNRRNDKAGA